MDNLSKNDDSENSDERALSENELDDVSGGSSVSTYFQSSKQRIRDLFSDTTYKEQTK